MSKNSHPSPLQARDAAYGVLYAAIAAIALIGALSALAAIAPADASGEVRLKREAVSHNPAFIHAKRKTEFRYEIGGKQKRDLVIQAVRKKTGKPVRRWARGGVVPGKTHSINWNGGTGKGKGPAKSGKYMFRVKENGGPRADRSKAQGHRAVQMRRHRFPVPARHSYGDGYGAGRGHRGQDIFAKCGKRLRAARAGRVQFRGRGGSAGNYLVIDGRGTKADYVYMHLRGKPSVRKGQRVTTGQRIGRVGQSGNASGCHLHFELWSGPGWYEGGRAKRNVTKHMRRWDRFS